ncbi:FecR domain-containing protein [Paucibacter sp. O1-1]|nr:FecR domain-containing protein [Paucibacter sp. O1-1]MDA3830147.1 FecR domain-containing protein [Paucibacter sp. O1-1]
MERAFREWVAQSEAHGYAFERCTDVWTDVQSLTPAQIFAGMARRDMKAAIARERFWQRFRWPLLALLAVSIMAAAYGVHRWLAVDVYSTEVGGQQQVLLADGTRMSLNTQTRVRVELDTARRSVTLDAGEAMFEVAKDPLRPFVVHAGGNEVVAVGTVFTVRVAGRGDDRDAALSVVLVEGEVSVQPALSTSTQGGDEESPGDAGRRSPALGQGLRRCRQARAAPGGSAARGLAGGLEARRSHLRRSFAAGGGGGDESLHAHAYRVGRRCCGPPYQRPVPHRRCPRLRSGGSGASRFGVPGP